MVSLLRMQLSRAIFLAGAILLAAIAAGHAQTPQEVFANAAAWHPMSAWIVVPIAFILMSALIWVCSRFIRNNPEIEAQMRLESGDRSVIPNSRRR